MVQWFGILYKILNVSGSNPMFSVFFLFCFIFSIYLFIHYYYYFYNFCILVMISPLLASEVRVGRLCWVGQGPVVLAAARRPTNLDNGSLMAYCVFGRRELGLFG